MLREVEATPSNANCRFAVAFFYVTRVHFVVAGPRAFSTQPTRRRMESVSALMLCIAATLLDDHSYVCFVCLAHMDAVSDAQAMDVNASLTV